MEDSVASVSNKTDKSTPKIHYSRDFPGWLIEQNLSIAFTTYQANKLLFIGVKEGGRLSIEERTFERSMGIAVSGNSIYLGTAYQVWRLENYLSENEKLGIYDRLFVPTKSWVTGDVNSHDIAIDKDEKPVFVNTLFSCLATISDTASFKVLWKPHFVSKLAPEDRCHLNGLAMLNGEPKFVTVVGKSDIKQGWRDHRSNGGIVLDVETNEVVCNGLSMPHSPRFYNGRLWLINSGRGEFGYIDNETCKFVPVTFCPGYGRGLAMLNGFALIGLSQPRHDGTFSGLPLDDALERKNEKPHCGILVIDLQSGDIVHTLTIDDIINELYDVATIPGSVAPSLIGLKADAIRTTIKF